MILPSHFTIRVYGLLRHQDAILLSRENIRGKLYTKFPGGGLEFGEGTLDCLKREFSEELGIAIRTKAHFYTTEPYLASAFDPDYQVVSIYYTVETDEVKQITTGNPLHAHSLQNHGDQIVYWKPVSLLREAEVSLPLDKIVVQKLRTL